MVSSMVVILCGMELAVDLWTHVVPLTILHGSTRSFQRPPCTDDVEMRVCKDQASYDEDIAIEEIDIYVQ